MNMRTVTLFKTLGDVFKIGDKITIGILENKLVHVIRNDCSCEEYTSDEGFFIYVFDKEITLKVLDLCKGVFHMLITLPEEVAMEEINYFEEMSKKSSHQQNTTNATVH